MGWKQREEVVSGSENVEMEENGGSYSSSSEMEMETWEEKWEEGCGNLRRDWE